MTVHLTCTFEVVILPNKRIIALFHHFLLQIVVTSRQMMTIIAHCESKLVQLTLLRLLSIKLYLVQGGKYYVFLQKQQFNFTFQNHSRL